MIIKRTEEDVLDFNPRSPSGLRRDRKTMVVLACYFNPRSPSGLRPISGHTNKTAGHFNPRSPSGLRLQAKKPSGMVLPISIHAARVGCDIIYKLLLIRS